VDRGDGNLEPREIKLGVKLDESVEVLEGLAAGENVVVSGNFLVDSESQLKAALRASAPGKDAGIGGKAAPGHVH
jgi:Cu(I)/Ag(I) efflux system membrane fusion protein